jgi:hypothetical protein
MTVTVEREATSFALGCFLDPGDGGNPNRRCGRNPTRWNYLQ